MVPSGKAIYARRPDWYPEGNPALYAKALGCSFVALNHFASRDEHLQQAHDLGLPVFLWSHPDSWTPGSWLRTLDDMAERVYANSLQGLIADPEGGWQGHGRALFAEQLAIAAESLPSVGITSYPSWFIEEFTYFPSSKLWGSPQLYGILDPGSIPELHRRAESWREVFGKNILPSLAAWTRTPIGSGSATYGGQVRQAIPPDQKTYLEGFTQERGALLWQTATATGPEGRIRPWPGTEGFEILQRWQPAGALGTALIARFFQKVVRPYPSVRWT